MSSNIFATGILALAISMTAASSASALEGACLWESLAPERRTELLANYRTDGIEYLDRLRPSKRDIEGWAASCGVSDENTKAAGVLLSRAVMIHGAPDVLTRDYGVTADALAGAWNGIDEGTMAAARKEISLLAAGRGTSSTAMEAAMTQMLKPLRLPPDGEALVGLYVIALLSGDLVADF